MKNTLSEALIDRIQQDDSIQPDDEFYIDENGGKTPPPTTQNIFNPLIIQQSGANSTVIPNYGTINLDLSKKGGGDNE